MSIRRRRLRRLNVAAKPQGDRLRHELDWLLAASNYFYTGTMDAELMDTGVTIAALQRAWMTLSRQAQLPATDERLQREAGIDLARPSVVALARLNDHGPLTITELATLAGVDVSTMSRTLRHLTDRGLARRQRRGDLRCVLIGITPEGCQTVEQMIAAGERMLHRILDGWSETDRSDLARLLARFSADFVCYASRDPQALSGAIGDRR
jgi:DNA-binding MarR family transcriptional regulator